MLLHPGFLKLWLYNFLLGVARFMLLLPVFKHQTDALGDVMIFVIVVGLGLRSLGPGYNFTAAVS